MTKLNGLETKRVLSNFFWLLLDTLASVAIAWIMVGCAKEVTCYVQSDTHWSGSFAGKTISGEGNQEIILDSDASNQCAIVQKETAGGYLRIQIEGSDMIETTVPYGVVYSCGGN